MARGGIGKLDPDVKQAALYHKCATAHIVRREPSDHSLGMRGCAAIFV